MSVKVSSSTRTVGNQRTLLDIASKRPEEGVLEEKVEEINGGVASNESKDLEKVIVQMNGKATGDSENDACEMGNIDPTSSSASQSTKVSQSDCEVTVTPPSSNGNVQPSTSADTASPLEKKVKISTPTKQEKSPSNSKKTKKSSPWYTVLTSSYKSKLDEFRKVFKTLPENERLVADYSCALQKDILVHGRMYVTENWICFYANIFRWETVLTVPLKDVTAITKERTIRFIPNAIQVTTATEKYFFASFMSRDKSFLLLFKVWQNSLLGQKMTPLEYWTWIHKLYGSDLGLDEDELPEDYIEPLDAEELSKEKEKQKEEGQNTPGSGDEYRVEDVNDIEDDEISKSDGDLPSGSQNGVDPSSASDHEEVIDPVTLLDIEGKVVLDEMYNIPVDQLFMSFLAGPEPLYQKVLHANGSSDITYSDWTSENDLEERTFYHNMQVNTGLTTKKCEVEERYFAKKSLLKPGRSYVVSTSVQNKGVPYSDYFVVQLGHVLTAVANNKSHLRIIMSIVFSKSPMGLIRNVIEKGIESGVRQNKNLLNKLIRLHLEKPYKRKKARKKSSTVEEQAKEEKQPKRKLREKRNSTVINAMKWVLPNNVSTQLETRSLSCAAVILILFGLFSLLVFNIFLFVHLQYLHHTSSKMPDISLHDVMSSIESLPEESREWLLLLHQQQQYHELEMKKWREIMSMCVNLMKQIEATFEELKVGIQTSSSTPDLSQIILEIQRNLSKEENISEKEEL